MTQEEIDNRGRTPPESRVCLRGPDEPRTVAEQNVVRYNDIDENRNDNFDIMDNDESLDGSDVEEEILAPEGVRRNPVRALRGINRRYHNEDFVNLSAAERQHYVTDTLNLAYLAMLDHDNFETFDHHLLSIRQQMQRETDERGIVHDWHPLYLATKASADDNPTLQQVLASPERRGWEEAMQVELDALEKMNVYIVVPRSAANGKPILDSTWAFKRKRYPDGSVRKLKARLCVRGDQQKEGVDYFQTYSPVVQWSTVRILLVLAVTLNLMTKQVDYTNAFVQADVDTEVFVEMPPLFVKDGYFWQLKKSLHGLRQSPLNFFTHLKSELEARNWLPSQHDPCLFYKGKVTCLVYVDDCLFFAEDVKHIDKEIQLLREPKPNVLDLSEESDVAGFLGILIEKTPEGIELKQTGLIKRIVISLGLEDSTPKSTPAEKIALGKDENGQQRAEGWNYRSVVGMMSYLATNSRRDIAFAVNQCCRFSNDPKRSHEKAVKRIGRYLKGTSERGMVIHPNSKLGLKLYADADFAGLFAVEDKEDPICVKSRTGWVLTLGGVPVTWSSKLQTEIALSTMEAEYIALSMGMRELVGSRKLMSEITIRCKLKREESSRVSRVYEDNEAALKHAVTALPKLSPRTKHIAVKYHWFKKRIELGIIEMFPISTKEQKADIFTKGLAKNEFEDKRKLLMGW